MLMSNISGITPDVIAWLDRSCTVTLRRVTCKREAPRSDGDIGGVSVTGTPMLKSVMALRSKWRGRVLARNYCPYLNRWADPLFIDVLRGLGCSGDLIGLNSECSQQVDMLQVYRHRVSNRPMLRVHGLQWDRRIECCDRAPPSACTGRCEANNEGPTELVALRSCHGSSVRANDTGPGCILSGVHGRYRQCGELGPVNEVPGEESCLVSSDPVGSTRST
ncbi:hypothetical protein TIFTF001_002463 [Ficus carica]|uniref:Uncharacterized protein n=1 Tax=Ficus carica TaxID=3494 RepID=A0AA88CS89_FICCA|nr:hypothetical protein TIFTF001_002463 [Ficus carica]